MLNITVLIRESENSNVNTEGNSLGLKREKPVISWFMY